MDQAAALNAAFVSLQTSPPYAEAAVTLSDGSRLLFCHRVGERWARAQGSQEASGGDGLAGQILASMQMFRLNAKHLDITFQDGSRWEIKPSGAT